MNIQIQNKIPFFEGVSINEITNSCNTPFYIYSQKIITDTYNFLQDNLIKKEFKNHKYFLWKSKDIDDQVYLNYNDVLSKDGFKFFLKNLYEFGFCVIKNCKTDCIF